MLRFCYVVKNMLFTSGHKNFRTIIKMKTVTAVHARLVLRLEAQHILEALQ